MSSRIQSPYASIDIGAGEGVLNDLLPGQRRQDSADANIEHHYKSNLTWTNILEHEECPYLSIQ